MTCIQCGKELTKKGQHKYCSRVCMYIHLGKARKDISESKRQRICETCGKEFLMRQPSGKALKGEVIEGRFCSNECKGIARRKFKEKKVWHCKVCGKELKSYAAYCSDECIKNKEKERMYQYNKAKKSCKQRICKGCGNPFVPEYGNKRSIFCSDICLKRIAHDRRKAKAKAADNGVYYEYINPINVFKRDGWRCQLCGRKLTPKHRGTFRDDAPELDHIIPWARGGEHSYRNTQCACRKCNNKKGARELGQLRLFG